MNTRFQQSIVALLTLLLPFSALALSAEEIAQKVNDRDDGDNSITTLTMTLIDKNGDKRVRSMKRFSKDKGRDVQSAIFFLQPSDVRNTAFLTIDYDAADKDDDQWLYLPALRKTKRIVSSNKSGSFMGSDLSYSDMTKRVVSDYSYKIAKETKVGEHDVWILEATPKSQKVIDETGYKKSYIFVRKDIFMVIRGIHFTTDGLRKYLDIKQLKQIDGIWVATELEMRTVENKKTIHSTVLNMSDIRFNQSLEHSFFNVRSIEKGL